MKRANTRRAAPDRRLRQSLERLTYALADGTGAERASLFATGEGRAELLLEVVRAEQGRSLDDAPAKQAAPAPALRARTLLCVPVRDHAGRVIALIELVDPRDREAARDIDESHLRACEAAFRALLEACATAGAMAA